MQEATTSRSAQHLQPQAADKAQPEGQRGRTRLLFLQEEMG